MTEEDQITTKQLNYLNVLTKDLPDEVVSQHIQKPLENLTKQEASAVIEALKELPENAPLSKAKIDNVSSGTKIETVKDDIHILTNEEKEYYKQKLVSSRAIVKTAVEADQMMWSTIDQGATATLVATVFSKIAKDKYYLDKGE